MWVSSPKSDSFRFAREKYWHFPFSLRTIIGIYSTNIDLLRAYHGPGTVLNTKLTRTSSIVLRNLSPFQIPWRVPQALSEAELGTLDPWDWECKSKTMGAPCSDLFLFSMVLWAQVSASQQIPTGYWMNKKLEPPRIIILQCVKNLFSFMPSTTFSSFSLTMLPYRVSHSIFDQLLGNPSSHCAEINPLNFHRRMYILPSGTPWNTEQFLPLLLFNLQISSLPKKLKE